MSNNQYLILYMSRASDSNPDLGLQEVTTMQIEAFSKQEAIRKFVTMSSEDPLIINFIVSLIYTSKMLYQATNVINTLYEELETEDLKEADMEDPIYQDFINKHFETIVNLLLDEDIWFQIQELSFHRGSTIKPANRY
jgi:hypothetical protein